MRMTRQGAFSTALAAAMLMLHAGCGDDDSSSNDTNGSSDGGTTGDNGGTTGDNGGTTGSDDDGGTTGGDGGGGTTGPTPLLDPGVAGAACTAASDCGPSGSCVEELGGGALSMLGIEAVATPGGYCTAACSSDGECGEGGACFGAFPGSGGGECRSACAADSDCRDGYECAMLNGDFMFQVASTCQPLPPTDQLGDDEAGSLCETDEDCPNGSCDDGLCTGACTEDSHCGAGGICLVGAYGSLGSCAEACSTNEDCQNADAGYTCSSGDPQICVERLQEGKVGESCTADTEDTDCPGGECREEAFGDTYPGGYCVGDCDVDADCFAGGVCINNDTCLKSCADSSECRDGYECQTHPLVSSSTKLICYPSDMATQDGGTQDAGTQDAGTQDAG